MRFIELTYYRPEKRYGTKSGDTNKKFHLDPSRIVKFTQYDDSIKLSLDTGEDLEISESLEQLVRKIKNIE